MLAAYQLLQVAPWASHDEIVCAYRRKAKEFHPDVNRRDDRRSDEMVRLNVARDVVAERYAY